MGRDKRGKEKERTNFPVILKAHILSSQFLPSTVFLPGWLTVRTFPWCNLPSILSWSLRTAGQLQENRMAQDQYSPGYCVYNVCVQSSLVQALYTVFNPSGNHVWMCFAWSSGLEFQKSSKTSIQSTHNSIRTSNSLSPSALVIKTELRNLSPPSISKRG